MITTHRKLCALRRCGGSIVVLTKIILDLKLSFVASVLRQQKPRIACQPGFYSAFGVKVGDKMYLAPEQRVSIW